MFAVIILLLGASYSALQSSWVQTRVTQIVASRLSEQLNANILVGKVDIGFFKKLHLEEVLIKDQNNDTLLFSPLITARIDTLKIKKRRITIDELVFKNSTLNISRDSAQIFNFRFILDALGYPKRKNSQREWNIRANHFNFGVLHISYNDLQKNNSENLIFHNFKLDISDFHSISDSLIFKINQLSLNDGGYLNLQNAAADVTFQNHTIEIDNLDFKSNHSELRKTNLLVHLSEETDSTNTPFNIQLRIGESQISFKEIGELVPSLKGMTQNVELSGLIYGNADDLKGKNVVLKTGENTEANLDFYINDATNPENMYLFLDVKQSKTSFNDVSNFRLPNISEWQYLNFPDNFYEAGPIKFKGNFSGFLSDFVTFGTFESEMGILTTDILVTPEKEGVLYYSGNIATSNYNLGKLLQSDKLGKLTFNGSADGKYNKTTNSISGTFKGKAQEFDLNNYNYKNITLDGVLSNKKFDGLLAINDPNLQFSFLGELDLNSDLPRFDFNLNLEKALLSNLNFTQNFPKAEVALKMKANFTGNRIDNLEGSIYVDDGYYTNRNGSLNLKGLELKSTPSENGNLLAFVSNYFDVEVDGNYHFNTIGNAFEKIIHHYIPSTPYKGSDDSDEANVFNYSINVKDIDSLVNVFVPGIEFETPFLLYGSIDSPSNNFLFNGSIPGIKYKNIWARNIFIGTQNDDNLYSSKFRIGEIFTRGGHKIYNFAIDSKVSNNILDNAISWSNFDELTYSGSLQTQTVFSLSDSTKQQYIEIKGLPSGIYVADTLWSVAPFTVSVNLDTVTVNNFKVSHANQLFSIDGMITNDTEDLLNLTLRNIDLSYFDKYLNRNIGISGIVNGTFGLSNVFKTPVVLSNLSVDDLRYKEQFIGDISLINQWDADNSSINSELKIIRNHHQNLYGSGSFKPATSEIDFDVSIDSLSVIVLETFMQKNFSNFHGTATGHAKLSGTPKKLDINGFLMGHNAGLTVNVTQIPYSFSDTVFFKNDTIDFRNITVFDDANNSGKFDGTIVHENFNNMIFDLHLSSEKIRALNTTSYNNEQFYGTALANGNLDITGHVSSTKLTGTATTLPGTVINISMESDSEIEDYDFIEFVSPKEQVTKSDFFIEDEILPGGEFDLSLTIEATPEAKVQLIYNSKIGDIIKAQGKGILSFDMDSKGNMMLSGNYYPTKGEYLFTLQNVLNKRFTIKDGGSIIWSGDPYNAIIDLTAIYKLKASLYDLLVNSNSIIDDTQRIQVECIIELDDELVNPTIGFDINFPNVEELLRDELQQYFNTEEEMNKQILSLVVLGKFYTPEYLRGTYEAQTTNMVGTTASEVFSNQLSNWLSQISNSWDVGLNYRPGNDVTEDEIEFALSTQIFNDRVTLNGNIGNNTNQYYNTSSQIVGDFDMSVKLVPSGKIQLKAYNQSNNDLIYETAPYTQGVGLSFTEEYNSINELFKKMLAIFKKKKKE